LVSGGRAVSWARPQTPVLRSLRVLGRSPWACVVEITADSAAVAGRPTVDGVNFAVLDTRTRVRRQVHFLRPLPHAVDLVGDETLAVTVRVFETADRGTIAGRRTRKCVDRERGIGIGARRGTSLVGVFQTPFTSLNNRPWTLPELSLYAPPALQLPAEGHERAGKNPLGSPVAPRQADHLRTLPPGSGTHRRGRECKERQAARNH